MPGKHVYAAFTWASCPVEASNMEKEKSRKQILADYSNEQLKKELLGLEEEMKRRGIR